MFYRYSRQAWNNSPFKITTLWIHQTELRHPSATPTPPGVPGWNLGSEGSAVSIYLRPVLKQLWKGSWENQAVTKERNFVSAVTQKHMVSTHRKICFSVILTHAWKRKALLRSAAPAWAPAMKSFSFTLPQSWKKLSGFSGFVQTVDS